MFNFRFLRRTEEDVEIKKVLEGPQNELGSGNSSEKVMEYLPAPLGCRRLGSNGNPQRIQRVSLRRASHCSRKNSLRRPSSRDGWITADKLSGLPDEVEGQRIKRLVDHLSDASHIAPKTILHTPFLPLCPPVYRGRKEQRRCPMHCFASHFRRLPSIPTCPVRQPTLTNMRRSSPAEALHPP